MTAVVPAAAPVQVWAADRHIRDAVGEVLTRAGAAVEPGGTPATGAVAVCVGRTVDDALAACPPGAGELVVIADIFGPAGVLRAMRRGARVMLRGADVTAARLDAALACTRQGDGRLPREAVVALLAGRTEESPGDPVPVLTARQTDVLALMAEGHGNAGIARALSCSEHTVKNVIYELMSRLHVRNRAEAVARGLRAGLV